MTAGGVESWAIRELVHRLVRSAGPPIAFLLRETAGDVVFRDQNTEHVANARRKALTA